MIGLGGVVLLLAGRIIRDFFDDVDWDDAYSAARRSVASLA
jgi:hypothetical protein